MNRLRFEHLYFCRNCEDEFEGHPFGFRFVDRFPLCRRCTILGEQEGIAHRVLHAPEHGSKLLIYFLVAFALLVAAILVKTIDR